MKIVNHEIAENHPYLTRGKVYEAIRCIDADNAVYIKIRHDEGRVSTMIKSNVIMCQHVKNYGWEVVK